MTDNELRDLAHREAIRQLQEYRAEDNPLGLEWTVALEVERLVQTAQVIIGA